MRSNSRNEGNPRVAGQSRRTKEEVKAAVLAATYELLTELGLGGVSVDEVSRRSNVAKTTIYRYWPTRSSLLLDTCVRHSSRPVAPDTGNLRDDLTALTSKMAMALETSPWSSVLPSIVDAAEREPEIAALQMTQHASMMSAFGEIVARAQARGELSAALDSSEITAAIVGPLFYRRWFSRQKIDERFVQGLIERALVTR